MAIASIDFEERLDRLDLSLFGSIPTQSHEGEQRSWLALQRAVRRPTGYTYLEIGSHLGGSIQQHLLDPWCKTIISIDKRPLSQPDDRGEPCHYEGNSTERMLQNLRRVAPDKLSRLHCFDADTKNIDASILPARADFCFIDGEHTHNAVLADFEFCLRASSANAVICFHDDNAIWRALRQILFSLRRRKIMFTARKLDDYSFAILLRSCPAASDPVVCEISVDGVRWLRDRRLGSVVPDWSKPVLRPIAKLMKERKSVRQTARDHLASTITKGKKAE